MKRINVGIAVLIVGTVALVSVGMARAQFVGGGSIGAGASATTPASDAPHPRQNFALSRLSVPHFGQIKLISSSRRARMPLGASGCGSTLQRQYAPTFLCNRVPGRERRGDDTQPPRRSPIAHQGENRPGACDSARAIA